MGLEKINVMRKAKGIGIDELSELSGVPKGTLSKITAGITTNPSLATVRSIVMALGYTLDDLEDEPRHEAYTEKEQSIIKKYRRLPETGKQAVENIMDTMLSAQPAQAEEQKKIVPISGKEEFILPIAGFGGGVDQVKPKVSKKELDEAARKLKGDKQI